MQSPQIKKKQISRVDNSVKGIYSKITGIKNLASREFRNVLEKVVATNENYVPDNGKGIVNV